MTNPIGKKWLPGVALTLLVLLMIGLRCGYFLQVRDYPGFSTFLPPGDQAYYHQTAQQIAAGNLLAESGNLTRGPGYSYFLGIIYRLFPGQALAAIIIQWGLGVLTGLLVFLLARRLFSKTVALTASLLYALYLPALCYEGALLMAALLTLLLTAGLYCLIRGVQDGSGRFLALSGFCFGWAVLCRPNNLILIAFGLLLLFFRSKDRRDLVWFAAPAAGLYGLLMIRNYLAGGGLFSITSQGRRVLMNSHFHQADGIGWQWSESWAEILAGIPEGWGNFMTFLAGDIAGHFTSWLSLNFSKLYAFFFNYEFSQFIDVYAQQEIISLLRLPSVSIGILSPLALTGLILLILDRRRPWHLPLAMYFLAGIFSVVIFYILSRFRLPLVPLFGVIGGYALWRLPETLLKLKTPGKIALATALLVLAWGVNAEFTRQAYSEKFMPSAIYNRGIYYAARQDYELAARDFQRVLTEISPVTNARVYYRISRQLARCYYQTGQPEKAEAVQRRLSGLLPEKDRPPE